MNLSAHSANLPCHQCCLDSPNLSIYLSMYVRPEIFAGQPLDTWRSVSKTAYDQTAGECNIFPAHCASVTNMCPHYNLSPAVKIYRHHRRIRSSSASHKDYRLVVSTTRRTPNRPGATCCIVVASLTKMMRRYWSKFSHVPCYIIRYFTGRLCSANERLPPLFTYNVAM